MRYIEIAITAILKINFELILNFVFVFFKKSSPDIIYIGLNICLSTFMILIFYIKCNYNVVILVLKIKSCKK